MDGEIPKRLRAARGYAGLSQPEMAAKLGLSEPTYKKIELGTRSIKKMEMDGLVRLAAHETNLPVEFFTADFRLLPLLAGDGVTDPEELLSGLLPEVVALARVLRREREANASPEGGPGHPPRVEGDAGA